ncbi:efflux RND transporter periplasmic adaptor subunit [Pseudochelatococcus contaminans]|uniref:Membrane fusion protein (Multidrug efflux system) n=1 Tax=Pseudochelatococcus contaminans TaxID=1538103 RepID=A0A7W5Z226_9HYPH|nr:efflux RND transporter periplasmic adaptor subunit [Pseudochelatococcus contaminans]MBB3808544.1 membrane fusion protein (multidrug efflux system) [Pseudochelatococcus contaminans]
MSRSFHGLVAACCLIALSTPALAQMPGGGGPPAVGVVTVTETEQTQTTEFNGRVEAIERVNIVARVSAFLEEQLFVEGADVTKGSLLFRLERPPYEADVEAKQAAVAQAQAQLENANTAFARADQLRKSGSGSQSALDNALAAQRTAAAQVRSAEAALHISKINLDYTEIRSPIDGRIGRALVTAGNVLSATSAPLATVVSQDPMYVTFPVPTRQLIALQQKYADEGGTDKALRLRLRLPDGRIYDQVGTLDFVDVSVAAATDSITLRGSIPNPVDSNGRRELFNDEFVRVILEAVTPQKVLTIPRAAVLIDQQGDYVYVVNGQNIAEVRRVKLGQSSAGMATVVDGLAAGDVVVVEGVQRVRPQAPVTPEPVAAQQATRG